MKSAYEKFQMISAKVVAVSDDTIFIDLGLKSEGLVKKSDFLSEDGCCSINESDMVNVYFLGEKNGELWFTAKLSGENAGKELLENAFNNGIPIEGKVEKEIKGGFEVTVGSTRAFCPYSQIGYKQKKEPAEYIGNRLLFRIQEYKNDGKNIVLSNRVILEEETNEKLEQFSKTYTEGMIVTGKVKSIESYGAFIDLNGFQALLPISEISHARVSNVDDVLKVGQEVTAKIIKADWKHERVSLSTKELEADPWEKATEKFPVGTKIEGKVARVADFGVFVNLDAGIDGLIHISKLNVERNTNLKKVYHSGDKLPVIVEKVDAENKRISLDLVASSEEENNASEYFSSHSSDDGETYNPFASLLKR